jgi:mono/diheme cytochrome c family protein
VLAAAGGGLLLAADRQPERGATRDAGAAWTSTVAATTAHDRTPVTAADQGPALFAGKGCSGCHVLGDIPGGIGDSGPDLTDYRGDLSFLRRWLENPPAVRPGTNMPDLGLTDTEIEALARFLSTDRR